MDKELTELKKNIITRLNDPDWGVRCNCLLGLNEALIDEDIKEEQIEDLIDLIIDLTKQKQRKLLKIEDDDLAFESLVLFSLFVLGKLHSEKARARLRKLVEDECDYSGFALFRLTLNSGKDGSDPEPRLPQEPEEWLLKFINSKNEVLRSDLYEVIKYLKLRNGSKIFMNYDNENREYKHKIISTLLVLKDDKIFNDVYIKFNNETDNLLKIYLFKILIKTSFKKVINLIDEILQNKTSHMKKSIIEEVLIGDDEKQVNKILDLKTDVLDIESKIYLIHNYRSWMDLTNNSIAINALLYEINSSFSLNLLITIIFLRGNNTLKINDIRNLRNKLSDFEYNEFNNIIEIYKNFNDLLMINDDFLYKSIFHFITDEIGFNILPKNSNDYKQKMLKYYLVNYSINFNDENYWEYHGHHVTQTIDNIKFVISMNNISIHKIINDEQIIIGMCSFEKDNYNEIISESNKILKKEGLKIVTIHYPHRYYILVKFKNVKKIKILFQKRF